MWSVQRSEGRAAPNYTVLSSWHADKYPLPMLAPAQCPTDPQCRYISMQLSCVLPLAAGLALGLVAGGLVTLLLLSPAPVSLGNTDPGPPDHRDIAR